MTKKNTQPIVAYRHIRAFPANLKGVVPDLTFRIEVAGNTIRYSWAACSPEQHNEFCYKTGRETADSTKESRFVEIPYNNRYSLVENILIQPPTLYCNLPVMEDDPDYIHREFGRVFSTLSETLEANKLHHLQKQMKHTGALDRVKGWTNGLLRRSGMLASEGARD